MIFRNQRGHRRIKVEVHVKKTTALSYVQARMGVKLCGKIPTGKEEFSAAGGNAFKSVWLAKVLKGLECLFSSISAEGFFRFSSAFNEDWNIEKAFFIWELFEMTREGAFELLRRRNIICCEGIKGIVKRYYFDMNI